jgi:hypothetical protein
MLGSFDVNGAATLASPSLTDGTARGHTSTNA